MSRMNPKKESKKRYDTQGMDPEMAETLRGESARRDTIINATKKYRTPWGWGLFGGKKRPWGPGKRNKKRPVMYKGD